MAHLEQDPLWEPVFNATPPRNERVLHNLPLPETDETGLIGRHEAAATLESILRRGRDRVVTVIGEGGLGKTALVVDSLFNLIDSDDPIYDCILYTSLKNERLTATGIEPLADAAADLIGIVASLATPFEETVETSLERLNEILTDIRALVVIDNLETSDSDEIIRLYDSLPATVTLLCTSRVGLGQLERRLPLQPLKPGDTASLLRKYAKARDIHTMATAPQARLIDLGGRLRHNPLAVRWFLSAVALGESPDYLVSNQDMLLEFCLRGVYSRLSPSSQQCLEVLFSLDRPVTFAELASLTTLPVDDVRAALIELQQGSLLEATLPTETTGLTAYAVTATARLYLRRIAPPHSSLITETVRREALMRASEDRRRRDEERRSLNPNSVTLRNELDTPIAYLLRSALAASKSKNHDDAIAFIERARAIDPEYFEIDRVEAFISSCMNMVDQTVALYQRALEAADAPNKPRVAFYLAGHLARSMRDTELALHYAEMAHEGLQLDQTAVTLAQVHMYLCHYAETYDILDEVLERATGKTRIIATTMQVNNLHRHSEHHLNEERNPGEALRLAAEGLELGAKFASEGVIDERLLNATLQCATDALQILSWHSGEVQGESDLVDALVKVLRIHYALRRTNQYSYFARAIETYMSSSRAEVDMKGLIAAYGADATPEDAVDIEGEGAITQQYSSSEVFIGTVVTRDPWKHFGFVEHKAYPDNIFFHDSDAAADVVGADLTVDTKVSFSVFMGPSGLRAKILHILENPQDLSGPAGAQGDIVVTKIFPSYAFA